MYEVEIEVTKSYNDFLSRLLRYDKMVDKQLLLAMREGVTKIEGTARRNAPVGVTSNLRGSLASNVIQRGESIVGRVGSTMRKEKYPLVMEKGRRFGKAPPPGALDRWVRIVLGVAPKRVRSVAFLVGRKIKQRGIVGRFFLRKAYSQHKRWVERRFAKAVNNVAKELSRGRA